MREYVPFVSFNWVVIVIKRHCILVLNVKDKGVAIEIVVCRNVSFQWRSFYVDLLVGFGGWCFLLGYSDFNGLLNVSFLGLH